MKNIVKTLRRLCACLSGFVLFVAGVLKLMDPAGSSLVMEEYFNFLHLGWLKPLAGFAGPAAAYLETLVGAALLTGAWRKITAIVSGITFGAFTLLTLALFIFNPSMDCGCFGEAVHLTHAQSLIKNLVLCALWAGAFLPFRSIGEGRKIKKVSFTIAALSSLVFLILQLGNVPLIDFTPLKPVAELEDLESPFTFSDGDGNYCDSLAASGPVMIVSAYNPQELDYGRADAFLQDASIAGFSPLEIIAGQADTDNGIYSADRRTLLTLNRSNGGATYINDGLIIAKWPAGRLPDAEQLDELSQTNPAEYMMERSRAGRLKLQGFLLYVFAVMLLL